METKRNKFFCTCITYLTCLEKKIIMLQTISILTFFSEKHCHTFLIFRYLDILDILHYLLLLNKKKTLLRSWLRYIFSQNILLYPSNMSYISYLSYLSYISYISYLSYLSYITYFSLITKKTLLRYIFSHKTLSYPSNISYISYKSYISYLSRISYLSYMS
jgi:hypothetical protein